MKKGNTHHIRLTWQKELKLLISDESWTEMCAETNKTTSNNNWREYNWKGTKQQFVQLRKNDKFNSNQTSACWRECGEQIATFSYLLVLPHSKC